MKMYDLNKVGYSSLPNYNDSDIDNAKYIIRKYLTYHPSSYYMLLNNENHYYTLFTFTDGYKFAKLTDEIINIARELGSIKSIETSEDGNAIEFWIMYEGEVCVFYLFDYARGVIEI